VNLAQAQEEERLPRDLLIEDVRHLASTIEAAHPDPYSGGGGMIAFHRRLQETIRSIPPDGMTHPQFYRHLLPFVASVRDGHTTLRAPRDAGGTEWVLPFDFMVLDSSLYVSRIFAAGHDELLAARLTGIEGVPFEELANRQEALRGYENDYSNLSNLRRNLLTLGGLKSLLPEFERTDSIRLSFASADGREKEVSLELPSSLSGEYVADLPSSLELPPTRTGEPAYGFVDDEKGTALLRIDNMISYREAFEWFRHRGYGVDSWARSIYQRYNDAEAPTDLDSVIAGIPAAVATFTELVKEMKAAGTTTLLIDLRRNGGGNSLLTEILLYFLFGRERSRDAQDGYSISRYSDLYFESYTENSLEKINGEREWPLRIGDYDFSSEERYLSESARDAGSEEDYVESVPTFARELSTRAHEAYYRPSNIAVLVSARTYSSAFDLAAAFSKLGTPLVGVPSGQAGNSFGDVLSFSLPNSGLTAGVSYKRFVLFPEDPDGVAVLEVDLPLTYERWAQYGFDRHATVMLAIDRLLEGGF
jgi:hypothetical protein